MSAAAQDMPAPATKNPTRRPRVPRWVVFVAACVFLGVVTSVGVAWGLAWRSGPITYRYQPAETPFDELQIPWDREAESENTEMGWKALADIAPGVETGPLPASGVADGLPLVWFVYRDQCRGYVKNFVSSGGGPGDAEATEIFDRCTSDALTQCAIRRHATLLRSPERFQLQFSVVLAGWPLLCAGYENAHSRELSEFLHAEHPEWWADGSPESALRPFYGAWKVGDVDYGSAKHVLPLLPLWPGLLADTAFYGGAWAILLGTPILIRRWIRSRRGGCPACGYSLEGLKDGAACPECGLIRGGGSPDSTPLAHRGQGV